MSHQIVEIKARCQKPEFIREILNNHNAVFKGEDHQVDTYFKVLNGRLKLRQGDIEKNLIHYNRPNQSGPKVSQVSLYKPGNDVELKNVLTSALEILVVVDKYREIYFIDNIKFHIDTVKELGSFVEIEAIDFNGDLGLDKINKQCHEFVEKFKINSDDLIECSYSDLLLEKDKL